MKMSVDEITVDEAKSLVERLGPHIDSRYDFNYPPVFPKTRQDICAVRRMTEDGSSYGYDTIYLITKSEGSIFWSKLIDTSATKDYCNIDSVVEKDDSIIVNVSSGGSYSGKPWSKSFSRKKSEIGLK